MKRIASLLLVAAAGCTFAGPAPAGPPPLNHDEVAVMVKAGRPYAEIVAAARERGVDRIHADCILDLKEAGASDELVKQLLACERRRVTPEERHRDFHEAWLMADGPTEWTICGTCGSWVRAAVSTRR
jgi:hypothetical protein